VGAPALRGAIATAGGPGSARAGRATAATSAGRRSRSPTAARRGPAATTTAAAAAGLAHNDVRGSFDELTDATAVAILIPYPVCALPVDEDSDASGRRRPCVRAAACGMDPGIVDAQRRSAVHIHIRRSSDRWTDPGMRTRR